MTTTKNLELYFQHAPVADLTALALVDTVGIVNGVIIEVAAAGSFEFQTPAVATPDGRDVIAGLGGGVWIRQTLPALTTTAAGAMAIGAGGTGALTQQTAIDNLAGAVTSTYYLRGNGTHVSMSAIQAGDVPTLNQDTSGMSAKATNIAGGDANKIPYQTAPNVTNFVAAAASSVLVTDGTNVPSLSTTLPAVAIGTCTCTDPVTSASASINTSLSDLYNGKETIFNGIEDSSLIAVTYDASTRIFSVTYSTGAAWTVGGIRYTHAAGTVTTAAHAATAGLYYLYYNTSGVLTVSATYWNLLTVAPIAAVYYNPSNNGGAADGILYYEMHAGNKGMSNATHLNLHTTRGTQYVSGCKLTGYTLNAVGASNINWQTSAGVIADEDILYNITAQAKGGANTYRVMWKTGSGASTVWNWVDTAEDGIYTDGTNIYYNDSDSSLTAISNAGTLYTNYYIVAIPAYNAPQIVVILSSTKDDAYAATGVEFASDCGHLNLLTPEALILYRILYKHNNTYGAPGNVKIAAIDYVLQNLVTVGDGGTGSAGFPGNIPANTVQVNQADFDSSRLEGYNVQECLNNIAFALPEITSNSNNVLLSVDNTSPSWSTATYPATTTINRILYSSNTNVIGEITTGNDSVLVTNGSGVPSLSTTLPAVAAGTCTCTDPTTLSSASINTALSNVYSAIVPPAESAAGVTSVGLSVAVATPQIITGAEVVLPPGKYLLSYSSSQTFTPTATNIGSAFSATTFIYNTTGAVPIANTSFTALHGDAVTGSEIFGGTASATVVATFGVTTTLDIYTQLNSSAIAGATFVADYTTITAVRLANTQTAYSANGTLAADSTSTSPQIVAGAHLVLPAGNYLLSYSTSQNLTTLVADAGTAFTAKAYIYNTTGAVAITNTTYTAFSGYATTGAEIFGGTAAATVFATFGVTTTLDAYIQLSAASAGADTYSIVAEITAVKLD